MNKFALAASAAFSVVAISTPTQAAEFKWTIEYTDFFDEGAAIIGSFTADDAATTDGIVDSDEFTSWMWSWTGNSLASAFDISSSDPTAEIQTFGSPVGFFVDGTPNLPGLADGLDQGSFIGGESGEQIIDFEFLSITNNDPFPAGPAEFAMGNPDALGAAVAVSDPMPVPEPTTVLGLLTVLGSMSVAAKRKKQTA